MKQPLAYIHPEAKLANNVVVEPFVTIDKNVVIGEGTWIGPNVSIMEGVRIGKNCKIFPGAVIGAIPQDLKFDGEETIVEIGDNTIIRESVTINRGTKASFKTKVGSNCLLMAYVHIAHDCVIGNNCVLANVATLGGHVVIDDWAIIGGLSAIHQFVHIGEHSFISGGSLVRKDVPPYVKAAREPLSYVGVNSVGLRRRGLSNEVIAEIQEIYRILYLKGNNNTKALEFIETHLKASPERDEIIQFIRNSSRGIMKGYFPENGSTNIED
ncbi:MAG TPA: acyl-[acyl-carrier-protein]--UDP-N-acetylglucosamine O-acyltransferase [Bacteroidales bacterium]|nr:MAG: acyl-[acyl-carrier-protein]--UDP-N-acetylglucosamine O-acyltransferase [Bacteroidetes bacterium GWF2_33_38]OFY90107.1 MAG: acyl-[acyl-carrier-protein]--UDP-N-acetylglucosamine O-acyltransferase [Bacteroidetes bacterium RIFOXYA2_FULL_33_7]HBF88023.1 acyl-[acyl-carrier-protein]--UDP-N-acetylglucosamine O-acyltransferase [Bacteroidales bacterium]